MGKGIKIAGWKMEMYINIHKVDMSIISLRINTHFAVPCRCVMVLKAHAAEAKAAVVGQALESGSGNVHKVDRCQSLHVCFIL